MHLCYLIETHFRLSIPTSRCLRISRDTFRVCQHSSFEHFHSLRTTMLVLFHFPQRSPFSPATNGIVSGLQSYVTCMVCNSNSYQSYRSNTFKAFAAFRLSWPFVLLLLYACWSQHTFILFAFHRFRYTRFGRLRSRVVSVYVFARAFHSDLHVWATKHIHSENNTENIPCWMYVLYGNIEAIYFFLKIKFILCEIASSPFWWSHGTYVCVCCAPYTVHYWVATRKLWYLGGCE